MKNILLVILFRLYWFQSIAKEIILNFTYYADDYLVLFTINEKQWNSEFNMLKLSSIYLKGYIGETLNIVIQNWENFMCLGAILTVGTTEFKTNIPSLWNYNESNYEIVRTIDNTDIDCIGKKVNQNLDKKNMYSFLIPDQLYCSNYNTSTIHGPNAITHLSESLEAVYFISKGHEYIIDFSDVIYYPSSLKDNISLTITYREILIPKELNPGSSVISKFISNDTKLELYKSFDPLKPIILQGEYYGAERISYELKSDNEQTATGCNFKIIVCHELCKTCSHYLFPRPDFHRCLSCIDGYILNSTEKGNCYKSICIPINTNYVDSNYMRCKQEYKVKHNLDYLKEYITTSFTGQDFNATKLISPRDDNNDFLIDFKQCIGFIKDSNQLT